VPKQLARRLETFKEPYRPAYAGHGIRQGASAGTGKKLDPIPQFKVTAKLGEFLNHLTA
jgi:hypothetical protein